MSHAPYEPVPQAPPHWAQQPVPSGRSSRLLPVLGAVLGALGLIAGVGAWFRPAPSGAGANPVYSEQQVADAKKAVCEAYGKGLRALEVAGKRRIDSPADEFPVAINTRLAEVAIGNYLENALAANSAAPIELKERVHQLSRAYQDIALTQLADGSKADSAPFAQDADKAIAQIDQLCQ